MPSGPTPCERFLGGFYVGEDERHDAIHRGRRARYIIVLDSYADAVAWRRVMGGDDSFITPLSQAAGESAKQLRVALALAEATERAEAGEPAGEEAESGEGAACAAPLELALGHIQALLTRTPSYADYDEFFVAVEKCAYCEAKLSDGGHADDCAWQAARRFLLEAVLDMKGLAA